MSFNLQLPVASCQLPVSWLYWFMASIHVRILEVSAFHKPFLSMSAARAAILCLILTASLCAAADLFDGRGDVGATKHAGSVEFDAARRAYTVAGGGANMWFTNDAFHFVWKKMSGDVTLAASIAFVDAEGGSDPHRKACLLVRQSLEPNSAYADAALHRDG